MPEDNPEDAQFTVTQEQRFRRLFAELRLASDRRSSLVTLVVLLIILPKYPFTGNRAELLPQAALLGGLFVPPLIILVLCHLWQEHYVRWRGVYLPAVAVLDWLAFQRLHCWELMPDVHSGDAFKLAFKVYAVGTSHLVTLCLFRTVVFRHQLAVHSALLLAGLCCVWQHCHVTQCKYEADFRSWAEALSWAVLPALMLAPADSAVATLARRPRGQGATERLTACKHDCFLVHGTVCVVAGYLIPLLIVWSREQQLRREFLAADSPRRRALQERHTELQRWLNPGIPSSVRITLLVLLLSGLCLGVRMLSEGMIDGLMSAWESKCPSVPA